MLLTPDPYPHFTLKECLEQPEAIARVRATAFYLAFCPYFSLPLFILYPQFVFVSHLLRLLVMISSMSISIIISITICFHIFYHHIVAMVRLILILFLILFLSFYDLQALSYGARMNGKRVILGGLDKNVSVSSPPSIPLIYTLHSFSCCHHYSLLSSFSILFCSTLFCSALSATYSTRSLTPLTHSTSPSPPPSPPPPLCQSYQLMNTINNMLLTGCGTSRHAAELGAKIMRDLECFDTVSVMDAAEVRAVLQLLYLRTLYGVM